MSRASYLHWWLVPTSSLKEKNSLTVIIFSGGGGNCKTNISNPHPYPLRRYSFRIFPFLAAAQMAHLSLCCNILTPPALPWAQHPQLALTSPSGSIEQRRRTRTAFAAKSGGFSLNPILKGCQACGGKGAIECPGCKGTGKNKKNGNIFERWKCFDCQGFGLKSCPTCGKGGLTPEQRGER